GVAPPSGPSGVSGSGVPVHESGSSAAVLPTQISHSPHSLPQTVVGSQRGHLPSSSSSSSEQVLASITLIVEPSNGTSQQPKQSQPGGVSGAQNSTQAVDRTQSRWSAGRSPVKQSVW